MHDSVLLDRYAKNAEDRLFLSRFLDLVNRASSRGIICYSPFLTPAQRGMILGAREICARAEISFYGAYDEAERTVAVIRPRDCAYDAEPPVAVLSIDYKGSGKLGHRDLLGALMALGIKREKLGDIIDSRPALVVCDEVIAEYILQSLVKVGRQNVSVSFGSMDARPAPETREISATVMSLRLDSVVAEGFGMSREKAAAAIRQGLVCKNWVCTEQTSAEVREADTISLKGMGRIRLEAVGGQSRKGRTFIRILRYI